MSTETTETITESNPSQRRCGKKWAIIILFFLIFIVATAAGYWQLHQVNASLSQQLASLQTQTTSQQSLINSMQQSMDKLQGNADNVQALTAKQEQMIAYWEAAQKSDLNKWYVAEAQYLVKLANDHVQYTHNVTMAITLLQRADEVLRNLTDANLLPIRQSIALDIVKLQSVPPVNTTQLYMRLMAINFLVDQLPLPENPIQSVAQPQKQTVNESGMSWWRNGLNNTLAALQKIVLVRNTSSGALPLVLPEEKIFLYQNLHAQLEAAMWSALHGNNEIYHASLFRADSWIKQYFAVNAPMTKSMLQKLQEMQNISLQVPAANISATLMLFDKYINPNAAQ